MKKCKNCKQQKKLVNSFHGLCSFCNNKRLEDAKNSKPCNHNKIERGALKTAVNRIERNVASGVKPTKKKNNKTKDKIKLDENFYEECFNTSNHKCEECNAQLPDEFLDPSGKVNARYRYSHIIPKSISPELRHSIDNINHLCMSCHQNWDFGDKKSMKIYPKNKVKFPGFLK